MYFCYLSVKNAKQELTIILTPICVALLGVQHLTPWGLPQPEASAECCNGTWDFYQHTADPVSISNWPTTNRAEA